MAHHFIARKDFGRKTLNALTRKGIVLVGSQAAPAFEGDTYFQGVSYSLNDNGTHRVRSFQEVLVLAS